MNGSDNTVRALVNLASEQLEETSSSARLDAELLLAHSLGWERSAVITESRTVVSSEKRKEFWDLIARRAEYEPVAYILGKADFWKADFIVTPDVLIPRPETEHLVEFAIARLRGIAKPHILDLGTGSGCIILSILQEFLADGIAAEGVAVDLSHDALAVATENAELLGLGERVRFIQSRWFSNVPEEKFDCIVSNPPYIAHGDTEVAPDLIFEPAMALYAERDGLADIEEILRKAPAYMNPSASLFIETGYKQHRDLEKILTGEPLFRESYRDYIFHRDLAGLDRVVELVKA
jgi:release factor glutamine methyltransferase